MRRDVLGFRASPELRGLIEGYGELSTAAQALILIGAAELGADLAPLQSELLRLLLFGRLGPAAQQQIRKLLNTPFTERLTHFAAEPELLDLGDPLAHVGIEV